MKLTRYFPIDRKHHTRIVYHVAFLIVIFAISMLYYFTKRRSDERKTLIKEVMKTMIFVEGGTFIMGCDLPIEDSCFQSELPRHAVRLSGFYLSKYEFTNGLYKLIMGKDAEVFYPIKDHESNSYYLRNDSVIFNFEEFPFFISWKRDLEEIIIKLNKKTGLKFRLPTEAEWEYAARGGKHSKGYVYSGSNVLDEVAWYLYNAKGDPMPVGLKKPNELGFYDMSGNMWERVQDYFDPDYYSVSDSVNPINLNGRYQVVRGGNCLSNYEYEFRPYYRFYNPGSGWYYPPGFRLCLDSAQLAR